MLTMQIYNLSFFLTYNFMPITCIFASCPISPGFMRLSGELKRSLYRAIYRTFRRIKKNLRKNLQDSNFVCYFAVQSSF